MKASLGKGVGGALNEEQDEADRVMGDQMNSNKRMELLIIQPLLVNDRFELTFSPF